MNVLELAKFLESMKNAGIKTIRWGLYVSCEETIFEGDPTLESINQEDIDFRSSSYRKQGGDDNYRWNEAIHPAIVDFDWEAILMDVTEEFEDSSGGFEMDTIEASLSRTHEIYETEPEVCCNKIRRETFFVPKNIPEPKGGNEPDDYIDLIGPFYPETGDMNSPYAVEYYTSSDGFWVYSKPTEDSWVHVMSGYVDLSLAVDVAKHWAAGKSYGSLRAKNDNGVLPPARVLDREGRIVYQLDYNNSTIAVANSPFRLQYKKSLSGIFLRGGEWKDIDLLDDIDPNLLDINGNKFDKYGDALFVASRLGEIIQLPCYFRVLDKNGVVIDYLNDDDENANFIPRNGIKAFINKNNPIDEDCIVVEIPEEDLDNLELNIRRQNQRRKILQVVRKWYADSAYKICVETEFNPQMDIVASNMTVYDKNGNKVPFDVNKIKINFGEDWDNFKLNIDNMVSQYLIEAQEEGQIDAQAWHDKLLNNAFFILLAKDLNKIKFQSNDHKTFFIDGAPIDKNGVNHDDRWDNMRVFGLVSDRQQNKIGG